MREKTMGKGFKTAILLLVILISGFLFIHSSVFNLKKIEVTGNEKVSKEEILALSGLKTGNNIFSINKAITAKSIEIHPMVKDAVIKRRIPSTILIQISERQVWALLPYQGGYLLIDDEGICIDRLNTVTVGNYPLISMDEYPKRINLGQAVNPAAIQMVQKVWNAIPAAQKAQISEFHYVNKEKNLIIYTLKGTEVRFGNTDRLDEKIKNFGEIFKIEENFASEGKEVLQYVDIRYKGQPVVKTGS